MGRMPLYPSLDQLITNNYPPLSFYIVGDVFCGSTFACYQSGKPFAVDLFNCGQRVKAGKLPPDAVNMLIANGRLSTVDEDPLLSW